jgi:Carboxypeptidase regulatory-like domain/TonB-dependent Receptor Plug Domain
LSHLFLKDHKHPAEINRRYAANRSGSMKNVIRISFAVILLVSNSFGQAQSGTVVGTVVDQIGAVVPGAKVTLVHEGTQFTRVTTTNASGQYVAYSFPTGRITITVEQAGFQKLIRSGVELTAADTLTVDMQLTVGATSETVQVTAEAQLLQSQTAAVSTLIDNQRITQTPLNGRTFTQLLQLGAGAIAGQPGLTTSGNYGMRANTEISVNGSNPSNNSTLIDGLYNRGLWVNSLVMVPTIDSIQEVRVMTSNYSAEYGAATGAVTIVQSKSGTNQFHGSVYEFLRNDKLDANTFFNNRAGRQRQPFKRNEFGATFGGPVRRDRTFFFGDYQGIRIRQPVERVTTIPTLTQRAMVKSGDFSGLGVPIFDPFTLVPGPNNTMIRAQFPDNRIPANRLDPVAAKLMDLLPTPTSPDSTRNFVFTPTGMQRTDQFDVRVDQNVGASDRLFVKFSYDNSTELVPGTLPPAANTNIPVGPFLASGLDNKLVNWSTTLNYTKVFNTSIINETRLGVVRWSSDFFTTAGTFNTADALGIPGVNINDRSGGMPDINITGFQGLGAQEQRPELARTISYQFEDILTVVRGNHTLKFGANYIRHIFNGFTVQQTRGLYNFNGQFTRQIGTGGASTVLADLALGAPSGANRGILSGTFGMRFWDFSAFADDTWRVNNRLNVNFGLRYEIQAPPYEVYDRFANFDVVTARISLAGRDGASRTLREIDKNNFAPRLGITYMLTEDRKTVLRTGFGVSYLEQYNAGKQIYQNLPFAFLQSFPTDQAGAPSLLLRQGFPAPVAPDINNIAALSGGNPIAWDSKLKTPMGMQWSLGVQRELLPNLLLDVSYVGSRTLYMHNQINPNQSFPGAGPQGPRRPYFQINPSVINVDYRTNWGASKYHSLQARVEKRYAQGLTASFAYTWSHNLANTRGIRNSTPPQDARCTRCEWGNAVEDRRHAAVVSHVYELPFGAGRRFGNQGVLAHVLGNWEVSGVWIMYSGAYFTPLLASPVSNSDGGGPARPDRIRDGNLPKNERTIDRWFDIGAFTTPRQFTFGNAGNRILEGPGYFNVDLGVHRNFRLTERLKMSFRWEMFNAFNRANFLAPNSSIGTAAAGQISGTLPARIMQLGLKLNF